MVRTLLTESRLVSPWQVGCWPRPPWDPLLSTLVWVSFPPLCLLLLSCLHKQFPLWSLPRRWAPQDAGCGLSRSAVSLNELALSHDFQITVSSPDLFPEPPTQWYPRCCRMPPLGVHWASQISSLNWTRSSCLTPLPQNCCSLTVPQPSKWPEYKYAFPRWWACASFPHL